MPRVSSNGDGKRELCSQFSPQSILPGVSFHGDGKGENCVHNTCLEIAPMVTVRESCVHNAHRNPSCLELAPMVTVRESCVHNAHRNPSCLELSPMAMVREVTYLLSSILLHSELFYCDKIKFCAQFYFQLHGVPCLHILPAEIVFGINDMFINILCSVYIPVLEVNFSILSLTFTGMI